MSLMGGSLFSPELTKDFPITITPDYDIADANRLEISATPQTDDLETNNFRGEEARVGVSHWKATEAYDVSWPKQRGAKSYRLYASMSPVNKSNLIEQEIKQTSVKFFPPYFSEVVVYFIWVSWIDADGVETYITDEPASLMRTRDEIAFTPGTITTDPDFYPAAEEQNQEFHQNLEYIRKSNRLELEITGEPAFLYLRRHAEDRPWGIPCSCVDRRTEDDSDPDYNGVQRCKLCFGTGIHGGYLPKISIAIRYGNAPQQKFSYTKRGFQLENAFNTYMLWTPTVRVGDIIVRAVDGSRFEVMETQPDISARGVRLHQEFNLKQIEKTDIRFELTDAAIAKSLETAKLPNFLINGYKSFG